ncbi:MAG: hypothetical protein ACP5M9_03590 [Candidatus Micrarchaeia archaeon]
MCNYGAVGQIEKARINLRAAIEEFSRYELENGDLKKLRRQIERLDKGLLKAQQIIRKN